MEAEVSARDRRKKTTGLLMLSYCLGVFLRVSRSRAEQELLPVAHFGNSTGNCGFAHAVPHSTRRGQEYHNYTAHKRRRLHSKACRTNPAHLDLGHVGLWRLRSRPSRWWKQTRQSNKRLGLKRITEWFQRHLWKKCQNNDQILSSLWNKNISSTSKSKV